MDPIVFGLENFDRAGAFRTHDEGLPSWTIRGQGELNGAAFRGPAELSDLLVESGRLEGCVATQVYRFAMGRREQPEDAALIDRLTEQFRAKDRRFGELLLDLASNETFAYRMEE